MHMHGIFNVTSTVINFNTCEALTRTYLHTSRSGLHAWAGRVMHHVTIQLYYGSTVLRRAVVNDCLMTVLSFMVSIRGPEGDTKEYTILEWQVSCAFSPMMYEARCHGTHSPFP